MFNDILRWVALILFGALIVMATFIAILATITLFI